MTSNFLQKFNVGTKARRQKKMRSIFLICAFVPLWQIPFPGEAEEIFFVVICEEIKKKYEYLRLTGFFIEL